MYQAKILKLATEQKNQKTLQKRQSYDLLIESTQKRSCIYKMFEKHR